MPRIRHKEIGTIHIEHGIPKDLEDDMLKSAQVGKFPFGWQVKKAETIKDIDAQTLDKAREVMQKEVTELGLESYTYYKKDNKNRTFIAVGNAKKRLSKDYKNNEFLCLTRIVINPEFRGKGLGLPIFRDLALRFKRNHPEAKGLYLGTDTPAVYRIIDRLRDEHKINFVYTGDEEYNIPEGKIIVKDYMWYFKSSITEIKKDLKELAKKVPQNKAPIHEFMTMITTFMEKGQESKIKIKNLNDAYSNLAQATETHKKDIKHLLSSSYKVIEYMEAIGTKDPLPGQ